MNTTEISDPIGYLDKMSKPLREKLRVSEHFPFSAKSVLDVGCADGTVTLAMADLFPNTQFMGIDINEEFIQIAKRRVGDRKNIQFETIYLRDLLARPERFDAVVFCSVLHEFFTYGQGISSVLKALADTDELLNPKGRTIIRDMILDESTISSNYRCSEMLSKITTPETIDQLKDFESMYGKIDTVAEVNHFLLKYMYKENWDRELPENYIAVPFQKYEKIFDVLGQDLKFKDSFTIDYLRNKWKDDFGLTDEELTQLRSTGILVAEKNH